MFNNDVFKNAYLSSISLIKEDIDQPVAGDEAVEEKLMKVTFVTSDAALIETLNAGIEEVVFRVKDEESEDPEAAGYSEVIFSPASFGELEIEEAELDEDEEDDDVAEECGDGSVEETLENEGVEEEKKDEETEEPAEGEDKDLDEEAAEDDVESVEDEDENLTKECKAPIYRAKRFSKYGY
jgi:hypothetical protein